MRFFAYCSIVLLQLCAFISTCQAAPQFADRKLANSGMWFDPSRNGEGFELRPVRDEIYIIWFAYDNQSKPIWYTAQGEFKRGAPMRYALQKHRFQSGRALPEVVGELSLTLTSGTNIFLTYTLAGVSGSRNLLQLEATANAAEIDHSGQWYQPTKSGYGLGLSETEAAGIAALYLYDSHGEPMWLFGGRNGAKSADYELFRYIGSCPNCIYAPPITRAAGTLKLEFPSSEALIATIQAPDAGVNFQINRVPLTRLTPSGNALAANTSLVAPLDSASLQSELFEATKTVYPAVVSGDDFSGFSSPAPAVPFSTPNLIAQNVDEAISLRTNGELVYALNAQNTDLRVLRYQESRLVLDREIKLQAPIDRVSVASQGPVSTQLTSELSGLIFYGDDVIVSRGSVARGYSPGELFFLPPPVTFVDSRVLVEFVKTNGIAPPRSIEIEGVLLATRRIGNQLYVLSRSTTNPSAGIVAATSQARLEQMQALPVEKFLPRIWINGAESPALRAPNVFLPPVGVPTGTQFIVLTQIDLDKSITAPDAIKSLAVLGQLTSFHFSERYLTMATNRFFYGAQAFEQLRSLQRPLYTQVHRFSLKASGAEYDASGAVDGVLDLSLDRAAQRFGEKQNELRLVTTRAQGNFANANRLTILAPSAVAPTLLKTISSLPNASQPASIGKPNETLFATRFVGDRLYAVTFRRTDPLYVIDLQDSAKPFIAGELEVPGFSDYLYPLGSNYLLGVGNDVTQSNFGDIVSGLQLSLFDISNPSRPTRVSNILLGNSGSTSALFRSQLALSALSVGPNQTHFAIPASINFTDATQSYSGLLQLEISHGSNPSMTLSTPLKSFYADSTQSFNARSAGASTGRGLYLRDLRVYRENGRIWYQRGDQVFGPL